MEDLPSNGFHHAMIRANVSKVSTTKIHPSKRPYIVFSILFLPIMALYIYLYVVKNDIGLLFPVAVCVTWLIILCLYVFDKQIIISDEYVTYGIVPWFRRRLRYSDIKDFYRFTGIKDYRGRIGPFRRLVIEPKQETKKKPIIISMKLFSKDSEDKLIEVLSKKIPEYKSR